MANGMVSDYEAAISSAALFDTSAAGKLVLTGPDAPMFLNNLCTNDIANLPLGGGCEAYFCDPRAKVQFQAWIYHVRLGDGRHAMWVETTPGRNEELARYLDRYLISERVEIADRTAEFAQFHIAGPRAKAAMRRDAVYRNNVTVSLIEALAAVYPATRRITGPDLFRAMARAHVRASPPTSPLLFEYGRGFPDFVAGYEHARDMPWLPDVARIDPDDQLVTVTFALP